jgi:hypothetical protein
MGDPVRAARLPRLVALLVATVAVNGCGAAMLARLDATSLAGPAEAVFAPGAARELVEQGLGQPTTTRALPDGSRLATYSYHLRNPEWRVLKWMFAAGTVITVGFTEPIWVPWATYQWKRSMATATFAYGADDRVVSVRPPPAYGAADESLGTLALDDVRARCREEHPPAAVPITGRGPSGYDACLARRLAIWGIE